MTKFVFDEGKRVGLLAQKLFPDGIRLERIPAAEKHAEQSMAALKNRKPLFEAGFIYGHVYAIADILVPVEDDEWDLYEVKSGTSIGEHHYHDVAFQRYTYEGAGLKIRKCFLVYVDNTFIKQGEIDPKNFFIKTDVTVITGDMMKDISAHVDEMVKVMAQRGAPATQIGPYCSKPHDCPLQDICWEPVSAEGNVFTLYSGGKKCFDLWDKGIENVADIPDGYKLNEKQLIQVHSSRKNEPFIDRPAIKKFLKKLEYPLYFLDFETLASALPIYDRTSPYEAVPFQFSLYRIKSKGAEPERSSYLAPGDVDPRPEVLRRLKEELGKGGSIIAYYAAFELQCLRRSSMVYKDYQKWFSALEGRFVDLLEPFKNFYYYNPKQAGSASLKAVLPAITNRSYSGLEIAEGGTASVEYYRVTFDKSVDRADREAVRAALEKYCDLDTFGMIEIVKALNEIVK